MTVVVLDANVLVPGFVGTMGSVSARLIDLWREGHYDLVISEHLLGEVRRALDDPYYRSRVPPDRADSIITLLRSDALLTPLTVPVAGIATHAEDDLVLATCLSAGARYLATRDRKLLRLETYRTLQILPPGQLLAILEATAGR